MKNDRYKDSLFVLYDNPDFQYVMSTILLKCGVLATGVSDDVRKIGLSLLNDLSEVDEGVANKVLTNLIVKE